MGITLTYITVTAYSVWKITQAPLPVNHGMVLGASYAIMLYLGYGKQSNSLYVRPKYGISYLRVNKECCFEKHICKLYCTLKPPHDVIFIVSTNISQKQYIHTWISYIYIAMLHWGFQYQKYLAIVLFYADVAVKLCSFTGGKRHHGDCLLQSRLADYKKLTQILRLRMI